MLSTNNNSELDAKSPIESDRRKKTALEIALHFLKFRPRSSFEIERKLKQKKFSPEEIKKTLETLQKQGFLNDLEFAKLWIRNRNLLRPSGRKLLFLELRRLGVDSEICEKSLNEEDLPDMEKAKMILERKEKNLGKLSPDEFKEKMIGILLRRGFSWDIIKEVLKI